MKKPVLAIILVIVIIITGVYAWPEFSGLFAVIAAIALAIFTGRSDRFKGLSYTAWIIAAVTTAMIYPHYFKNWGGINLRDKTLILVIIQLVMFGMGTHMRLQDFRGLRTTGKGVLVGLFCHFTVMPLMGLLLINLFHFDPEIAAGIILIGSCSSGLASNVMVYLAKGNLVLSVIVTAMATLAAPLLTPLLMKLLAGTLIEVHFIDMMAEIVKIVLVPIGAALLHDFLKTASRAAKFRVAVAVILSLGWIALIRSGRITPSADASRAWELSAFMTGAIVAGYLYHQLWRRWNTIDQLMPKLSMFGIIYFTLVTTAAGRDNLLAVGGLLFLASIIHNSAGYFFGYWLSRFFGMNRTDSRTIAFEVGLQNGGMASGIAGAMGKLGTVGLAAAVFSPWMNISGSLLANWWRQRPVDPDK
jgi:bile acid:Na+ symporter, BASS family